MSLTLHPVPGKAKSERLCEAFAAGAPKSAEGAVFYGVTVANLPAWRAAQKSGKPWYYIDNSYFDLTRGDRFRVTKNRLQVNAAARYEQGLKLRDLPAGDGKRFAAMGLAIPPWRERRITDYTLLVMQSPWFMEFVGEPHFLEDWAEQYHNRVKVRGWNRNKAAQMLTLVDDLKDAQLLVTHTSAAAVTAILHGVPILVSPMHALAGMIGSPDPALDERKPFLEILADNEFTPDEMRRGVAWAALQR